MVRVLSCTDASKRREEITRLVELGRNKVKGMDYVLFDGVVSGFFSVGRDGEGASCFDVSLHSLEIYVHEMSSLEDAVELGRMYERAGLDEFLVHEPISKPTQSATPQ